MGDFRDGDAEMAARWSLGFEDLALLSGKPLSARIGFAAQLLVYRSSGRFPRGASEISADAAAYIAAQSGTRVSDLADYDWGQRSGRRHRAEILKHLGFRRAGRGFTREVQRYQANRIWMFCTHSVGAAGVSDFSAAG